MPRIIPIQDLGETFSRLCHESDEPIYVTENGYGEYVIQKMKTYDEQKYLRDVCVKVAEAQAEVKAGRVSDAHEGLQELREKYGI